MDSSRLRSEAGFTLIELLVVIAIIGILAAIAIPQFAAYRKRGYEATLKTDLRNAAAAQEAYFAQYRRYQPGGVTSTTVPGYNKSDGVSLMQSAVGTNTFSLTATHTNCTAINWTYSSLSGLATGAPCP